MYTVYYQEIVAGHRLPFSGKYTQKSLRNAKKSAADLSKNPNFSGIYIRDEQGNLKASYQNGQEL